MLWFCKWQDGSISDQGYYRRGGNGQLGTLDIHADYSWKISGFTECSRPCGGGEWIFRKYQNVMGGVEWIFKKILGFTESYGPWVEVSES